jgi:hypothetical protein
MVDVEELLAGGVCISLYGRHDNAQRGLTTETELVSGLGYNKPTISGRGYLNPEVYDP